MLLSIIVIILVALIAYWHYLQGFFSAGLSALLSIIAAVFAVGYHEVLVQSLLGGKVAEYASAMALIGLFAAIYLILRILFDSLVPGNLRFPLLVDKIGAGVMGVVAAVFAVGVVVLAGQTLPFGPAAAGFERYPMKWGDDANGPKPIVWNSKATPPKAVDAKYDELDEKKFLNDDAAKLVLPVDDWLLGLVERVSDTEGPLACGKPFAEYHPNYLRELFGQRVGIQSGSKRTALEGRTEVTAVFDAENFAQQMDPEAGQAGDAKDKANGIRAKKDTPTGKLDAPRTLESGKIFLVVRTKFSVDDQDDGGAGAVSFAPAGIRLCYQGKDYYPVGTLEYPNQTQVILYVDQPDDCLFVRGGSSADLVFEMPRSVLDEPDVKATTPTPAAEPTQKPTATIKPRAFLEVKRLAHVDLSGLPVGTMTKAAETAKAQGVQVLRKEGLPAAKDTAAGAAPSR